MGNLTELLSKINEYNEKYSITSKSSEAEKLRYKLTTGKKTKEELLQLREEVSSFMKSDASVSDKEMIKGYTESLSMICSAIEYNLLK